MAELEVEYVLGYSTYGGFNEVRRTKSRLEADQWVMQVCRDEGAMHVYYRVTLNAPIPMDTRPVIHD